MIRPVKLVACIVGLALSSLAQAIVIVDTGSPATTQNGAIAVCGNFLSEPGGYGGGCQQSVALQFTLDQSYTITSAQGYLWSGIGPGTLTLGLYSDTSGVPGAELFSQAFSVPRTTLPDSDSPSPGWYGVSGVSWLVAAGTYWAAFEVLEGQSAYAALEFPAPIALPAAVRSDSNTSWTNIGAGGGGGLIITGDLVSPVPEPSTYVLMLAGLGVLGAVARRRQGRASA